MEGLKLLDEDTDLVILDIMMPGMSGLRTCEEIRKVSNVPVLFLTAKAQESDKLIGLMAGGDDYLPKPFSYAELLGRVKALLRRYNVYRGRNDRVQESADEYLEIGNIRIHKEYNEIYVSGEQKELSNIEYRILLLMMQHPGRIFSAQNLYESVWEEPYFYSCNGTVMVHIRKLMSGDDELKILDEVERTADRMAVYRIAKDFTNTYFQEEYTGEVEIMGIKGLSGVDTDSSKTYLYYGNTECDTGFFDFHRPCATHV